MKKYTLYSMTGFASKTFIITVPSGERSSISMNLKSLNSRFFESSVKLPLGLSHLETVFIKQFKEILRRGHIYFTAYLSNPNIFEGSISPAMTILDGYMHAIDNIKEKYNLSDQTKLDHILRLPNIFSKEEQHLDEESTTLILNAVTELINNVMEDRAQEGEKLSTDLLNRIAIIQTEMIVITQRAHIFVEEWKKKVHATLQEIGADENLIVNAQKSGLYSMLDKIDIHEESDFLVREAALHHEEASLQRLQTGTCAGLVRQGIELLLGRGIEGVAIPGEGDGRDGEEARGKHGEGEGGEATDPAGASMAQKYGIGAPEHGEVNARLAALEVHRRKVPGRSSAEPFGLSGP
jgi:uncharacterized protein (TIGR00255 family)